MSRDPLEHPMAGCPYCNSASGPYNAGKAHRFACHDHKVTWRVGVNIFSSWKDETEEEQRQRYREIEGYRDVSSEPCVTPSRRGEANPL